MRKQLTDANARETCQMNMVEAQRRVDFLESELARLSLSGGGGPGGGGSADSLGTAASASASPAASVMGSAHAAHAPTHGSHGAGYPGAAGTPGGGSSGLFEGGAHPSGSSLTASSGHAVNMQWGGRAQSLDTPASPGGASAFPRSPRMSSNPAGMRSHNVSGTGTPASGVMSPSSSKGSLTAGPPKDAAAGAAGGEITPFDMLKFSTAITAEKIHYRLNEVRSKLESENRYKAGFENMLAAKAATSSGASGSKEDVRIRQDLEQELHEVNTRIKMLTTAAHRYKGLTVGAADDGEDGALEEVRERRTGRLKLKLIGAINLMGRKSAKDELIAHVKVDGTRKATTRPTKQRWDESFDIQIEKAQMVEITIHERSGAFLGMRWFRLADLEENARRHHIADYAAAEETWLDMEPGGQLLLKAFFTPIKRQATERGAVFRRGTVG
ncbi:hypothetical protein CAUPRSCDRAFT_10947 [Caulochytrium protostelioides]|uniref:C2 domain-containing protein n=1 Tax=Caulochytrium protostelioides TaxID=1555241 RepID=A0A4P9WXY6_9FUNG|nr:hypothetical protein CAUPRSCDRAFT_10947 [Caulochytrium protostelioides]